MTASQLPATMVRERSSFRDFTEHYLLQSDKEAVHATIGSLKARGTPLEVDLGCGRGRFLIARAQRCPSHAFLGIERVLLRLRKVDARAVQNGISNTRLIRAEIMSALRELIPRQTVDVYYLYFPDPWPKRRHHVRRVVSPDFINAIHDTLALGGIIHLCTDHADYFRAMESAWSKDSRFAQTSPYIPGEDEETDFGLIFRRKGLPIHRCSFQKASMQQVAGTSIPPAS